MPAKGGTTIMIIKKAQATDGTSEATAV